MKKLLNNNLENDKIPLVSIVIPSYNNAQYLTQCIESCLAQSYPHLEIILVDDGSTDNTKEVLKPYLGKIIYLYQKNVGLAGARNTGHRFARGEYIAWLDSDDIAHPDRILIQVSYMIIHPEAVLVGTDFSAFDETGKEYNKFAAQYYSQLHMTKGGIGKLLKEIEEFDLGNIFSFYGSGVVVKVFSGYGRYALIWGNFIHPPTVMLRKDVCKKVGELKNTIPTQEDWDYFFRMSKYGTIAVIDYPFLKYRLHSQQMSSTANAVKNATGIVRVFENMLKDEPEYANNKKRLARLVLGQFCAGAVYALLKYGRKYEAIVYLKKCFLCDPLSLRNYKLLAKWVVS